MLIYDGDCGFCTMCARWIERRLRIPISVVPWQEIHDLGQLELTRADVTTAAYHVDPYGRLARGHLAIAQVLRQCRGAWPSSGRWPRCRPADASRPLPTDWWPAIATGCRGPRRPAPSRSSGRSAPPRRPRPESLVGEPPRHDRRTEPARARSPDVRGTFGPRSTNGRLDVERGLVQRRAIEPWRAPWESLRREVLRTAALTGLGAAVAARQHRDGVRASPAFAAAEPAGREGRTGLRTARRGPGQAARSARRLHLHRRHPRLVIR